MGPRDAAIAVLGALLPALPEPGAPPADQRLREFFRRHPDLGKRDRLQVGDLVFDVLRNLRLYQQLAQPVEPAREPERAPDARGRAPAPPDLARELVDLAIGAGGASGEAASRMAGLAPAVRYSLPEWLWDRLSAAHGARADAIAAALLRPSPIDIRANLLVGKAEALRGLLAQRGIEAVPIEGLPTGLRVDGRPNLEHLDLFRQGWFEVQDAGSQRIADACGARRGQLVVDFCAGGGGKSLAIAARMRNSGKVLAFDTAEERLSRLPPRAQRAGATIVEAMRLDGLADPRLGRFRARADVVLVDAPCSGTGTLRRSPDLKWRLSRARLLEHVEEQQAILRAASALVKPGGTLAYATCSLLREENEEQVERFDRPGFELTRTTAWLPDEGPSSSFFLAVWGHRHDVR